MKTFDPENINADTRFHLLNAVFATEGWQLILYSWNKERERIIREGKASRSDAKDRKMWAALEGFDRAVLMPEQLYGASQVLKDVPTENED